LDDFSDGFGTGALFADDPGSNSLVLGRGFAFNAGQFVGFAIVNSGKNRVPGVRGTRIGGGSRVTASSGVNLSKSTPRASSTRDRNRGEGDGGGFAVFLHGTTIEAAEAIVSSRRIRALSVNTGGYPKGSFFTFEASGIGLIAASALPVIQGKADSNGVGVVEITVPISVLRQLKSNRLIKGGAFPGARGFPDEVVFLPDALDALNQSATFRTIPPEF
jgi:hypothetical protein